MDENIELLQYIYQSSEMGVSTLKELLMDLQSKENKIKKVAVNELESYENFLEQSKEKLEQVDAEPKSIGMMPKMGSMMGVKKEVIVDNSDASIGALLTEGLTMGIVQLETKIKDYQGTVEKENLDLANNFLKFHKDEVEKMKEFL